MLDIQSCKVTVQVTFLSKADGGRNHPAVDTRQYRPSLVFGNPDQRQAILGDDGRTLVEAYRMACFDGDGKEILPIHQYETSMVISYYRELDGYEEPRPGSTFTIREGQLVVGFGEVLAVAKN